MGKPRASVWAVAPEPGIPEPPALLSDSDNLWLAYNRSGDNSIAVIRFSGVVEFRLSPINDEGLGKHPYAKAGLQWYSCNEITGSQETKLWAALRARHWVITFKDNTLDVVAETGEVVIASMVARNPLAALIAIVRDDDTGQR